MDLDLQQLGDDMHARREELFAEMEADDAADTEDEDVVDEADDDTLSEEDEETEDAQEQIDISRTRH